MSGLSALSAGVVVDPLPPPVACLDAAVPHAPVRTPNLTEAERSLALRNALRYFPSSVHATLAPEFAAELASYGHIYMHRFRPTAYAMKAHPISEYPAKSTAAAAIMMMIMNNLDPAVAQFPHELITYGGNGSVFSNWAQYLLTMQYLTRMTDDQTLVMYSGHPHGLFPSHADAPRVVVTNGMVIPNYSSKADYDRLYALGVTQYGQMTAGSWCYIGPQGIVHGTTLTLLNAARQYLGSPDLAGKVFLTSGLGGMSGAQAKAAVIAGAIGVVCEVDQAPLQKRYQQGWVMELVDNVEDAIQRIKRARKERKPLSLGVHANVVDMWERLVKEPEQLVELGSDQTSCHNPFNGGYYPAGVTFQEAQRLMAQDPPKFKQLVQASLRRHIAAIDALAARGLKFWDYGNSFLLECDRAGAKMRVPPGDTFRYPSYVQDIMGDIFSLGFGPFRWVCASGKPEDLERTDAIAAKVTRQLMEAAPERPQQNYQDNCVWIEQAGANKLVVGSQARILYSDWQGRSAIAAAFNAAVASGELSGPVILSRDHHDVSGTDSPWRETSNIRDGSKFCADMAVHNFVGDAFRGATWISLHNGGGCGWGEVTNGGFGLVLDGSDAAARRARDMLLWDVNNGITRRAWDSNANALFAIKRAMQAEPRLSVTLPSAAEEDVVAAALKQYQ